MNLLTLQKVAKCDKICITSKKTEKGESEM